MRRGLLLDEIDGLSTNDKGGLQELMSYINSYKPVKVTDANQYIKKRGRKSKGASVEETPNMDNSKLFSSKKTSI